MEVVCVSTEIVIMIVSLCVSIFGLFFVVLNSKRTDRLDNRDAGKNEGTIMSDIAHIKQSVDRMETNITNVDARYMNMAERLARVEESVENIHKRLEEIHEQGGG